MIKVHQVDKGDLDLPYLSLIYQNLAPYGKDLYLSGKEGAADIHLLKSLDITTVINCAVNLDFNFVTDSQADRTTHQRDFGPAEIRYYKIGLIDGAGNPATQLIAGYFTIEAAFQQILPQKITYPCRKRGNVLINCRGGRSRSVIMMALFLHINAESEFPDIDDAIAFVREKREISPDEWFKAPKPVLVESARWAAQWIKQIKSQPIPEMAIK